MTGFQGTITQEAAINGGFDIDRNSNPHIAYKGSRFNPTVWYQIATPLFSAEQLDRVLLALIDLHADHNPHVEPELAAARARLKRHLRKTLADNEVPARNHQTYHCRNTVCNARFWVADHDGDAVCPKCGNVTGME